jgi:hypothetical protein
MITFAKLSGVIIMSKVERKIKGWDIASLASVPFHGFVRLECIPKPVG